MLLALNKCTHVVFDPSLLLIETLSAGYYLWREGGRVAGKCLGIDFDAARELCVWLAIFVVSCVLV